MGLLDIFRKKEEPATEEGRIIRALEIERKKKLSGLRKAIIAAPIVLTLAAGAMGAERAIVEKDILGAQASSSILASSALGAAYRNRQDEKERKRRYGIEIAGTRAEHFLRNRGKIMDDERRSEDEELRIIDEIIKKVKLEDL